MKMKGMPLTLNVYESSKVETNKHFQNIELPDFERIYLSGQHGALHRPRSH